MSENSQSTVSGPNAEPNQFALLVEAQRETTIATLAASIVIAMSRLVSVQEVLQIRLDVHNSMFPNAESQDYREWEQSRGGQIAIRCS